MKVVHSPKSTVEVCFSPQLYHLFEKPDAIVVIVDIFRASSAICTAFEHGAKSIIPVATLKEALDYKEKGYLAGGERNGEVQKGFEMGNSPFSYMDKRIRGREIALTTTNGTKAIAIAREATELVIGSFINLDAVAKWLIVREKDVVIMCAGWKNRFNMEDSLFSGALTNMLLASNKFKSDCDSANASSLVYRTARRDLIKFLRNCSHRKRLAHLNLEEDVKYCLTPNQSSIVPVLRNGKLVPEKVE